MQDSTDLQDVHRGLQLQNCASNSSDEAWKPVEKPMPSPSAGTQYFVSTDGSDSNPGTKASPFKSLARAAAAAASVPTGAVDVIVRQGVHHLNATLHLGAEHR